jgi:hypothetical protein
MNQRGGIEGVILTFANQMAANHKPRLVVDQGHQPIEHGEGTISLLSKLVMVSRAK